MQRAPGTRSHATERGGLIYDPLPRGLLISPGSFLGTLPKEREAGHLIVERKGAIQGVSAPHWTFFLPVVSWSRLLSQPAAPEPVALKQTSCQPLA